MPGQNLQERSTLQVLRLETGLLQFLAVIAPEVQARLKKFTSACPVAASSNTAPARAALSKNFFRRAVAAGRAVR